MFSIPILIVEPSGEFKFSDGYLHKLEPDLCGSSKLAAYARLLKPGWHNIDFGFLAYSVQRGEGRYWIFPGLAPREANLKRKYRKGGQDYSKSDVERFVRAIVEFRLEERSTIKSDFDFLVHDLRRLSTTIYHAAEEAKDAVNAGNRFNAIQLIDNIIGAQSMLKIRTDVLDYTGNPNADHQVSSVPVYRRTDKVVRSFGPFAAKRNIRINISGSSFATSLGPNVFEIIPYVILDNAIKYSPANSEIEVVFQENAETISIEFKSLGPPIEKNELDSIFAEGHRSRAAQRSGISGSGIGLYLARQLVAQFGGTLTASCGDDAFSYTGGDFADITFCVRVPIEQSDANH